MAHVSGNLQGLKPAQIKRIDKLSRKRLQPENIVTQEFVRALTEISFEIKRQIGILINRSGYPEHVVVGDAKGIVLPDLKRTRVGNQRFRGLRLVHSHLKKNEALTEDDLTDLAILRLDLVLAVTMDDKGLPVYAYMAHLLPENQEQNIWQIYQPSPPSELEDNFLELITALENEFAQKAKTRPANAKKNRALLIGIYSKESRYSRIRMSELERLAKTARISAIDHVVQIKEKIHPKYVLGKGKLQEIVLQSLQKDIEMLIFDRELSPTQAKTLSDYTDLKIIDRTQLILDIFAQHATSRDGKLQIELAQMNYLKARLSEKDDNMSRLTGGIGGRGPGETKLEIGKRRVQEKITRLEKELDKIRSQRDLRRTNRKRNQMPMVSIIGYTNAGKSTLLNSLTNSSMAAQDALFATLDPTTRRLRFPNEQEIILGDTVGFIQDLPPSLMKAFMATLEELSSSDLLVHVLNIATEQILEQNNSVIQILQELNLESIPRLTVFNQIDRLSATELKQRIQFLKSHGLIVPRQTVFVSAMQKQNFNILTQNIIRMLLGQPLGSS